MENQKGRKGKKDIFDVFGKHFIQMIEKIFLGFFCSFKTDFKMFSGTVLFLYDNIHKDGKFTKK